MAERTIAPAGSDEWQGYIHNIDPVDLPPGASPDCANAFFYGGTRGLLGPRAGKQYAGLAADRIVGAFPYHVGGLDGMIFSLSNGTDIFVPNGSPGTPGGSSLSSFSSVQSLNQTFVAGPVTITINQFNQIVNVQFNNGAAGLTKTIVICVPVFNAADCTITYHRFGLEFTNGILTNAALTTTGTCTDAII